MSSIIACRLMGSDQTTCRFRLARGIKWGLGAQLTKPPAAVEV